MGEPELSLKAGSFTESVIREMTRLNLALHGPEKAINFAQGFPDFPPSPEIVQAAHQALDVNTPHNPTGKVFGEDELLLISDLCREHDAIAITDEIYEHLVYEGKHISMATLPGMAERTITISGASKTYSVTGWRIGWLIAPPALTAGIRKVHDFLTVGAAHPLQIAVAEALDLPASFYVELLGDYQERRDAMVSGLRDCGFEVSAPDGAYYVMAGIDSLGASDDVSFARRLVAEAAGGTVPAASFYHDPALGRRHIRFSFPKRIETIDRGLEALRRLSRP